jgi:signal transduction histidine kinase/BarA-like signal transduction histidine kinase
MAADGEVSIHQAEDRYKNLFLAQTYILELLIKGLSLVTVLSELIRIIEAQIDGMAGTIRLIGEHGLTGVAGPSLPKEIRELMNGRVPDPHSTSCGAAVFYRKAIFTGEIATDPIWENDREKALSLGYRSCWSSPIFAPRGEVIGTFAMYFHEPRLPTEAESNLIKDATLTAALVIQHAQNQDELKKAVSLLHATIESTADGILAVDLNGKITAANRRFIELWRVPGSIIKDQGRQPILEYLKYQIIRPDEFHWTTQSLCRPADSDVFETLELRDGRYVELYSMPQSPDGVCAGRVFSFRDITQRRLAELAATTANRARTYFLANISHEIRTPLGILLGYADLLARGEESGLRAQFMEKINENGAILLEIVDEILNLSKAEFDKVDIDIQPYPIRDVIDQAIQSLLPRCRDKHIRFEVKVSKDLPSSVMTDRTKFKQIIFNVIGNAIKFTEQNGSVRLTVEYEPPETLNMLVRDTGVGIPLDRQPFLFRPFEQADMSYTRQFGGTGLGLALSRRIAEALGGTVALVNSAPGKGSTFQIKIHAPSASETQGEKQFSFTPPAAVRDTKGTGLISAATPRLKNMKVLLAEDSKDNQALVSRFLKMSGAQVDIAENGEEAVQQAFEKPYDVILMDIQMPVKDGFEATQDLRQNNYHGPIVALTAHAMKEEKDRSKQIGFDDYLTKPVSRQALEEALARYTRTH